MVLPTLLSNIESPTASPLHVLFCELVRVRDHDTDGQKHIEETEWHHPCTATEGYTMDSFERAPRMPCFEVEAILHMMMIVYYNRCDRVVSQTHPITKIVPRWTSYRRLMKAIVMPTFRNKLSTSRKLSLKLDKIIDDVELRNGARPEEATSYSAMQDYVLLRRKVPAGSD
ncbi:hypothetical protein F441_02984 [Phytophthora nicotianae CJ01A1]|uniref:Uncharacterized protein n=2 Tax=Phytophthora nicotianae TaxID=4792 RepID=W2XNA8_PHYNI|nr:hypothetical protein F441_02984 [Phytophthora nicotianae CJ01A1]